MNKIILNTKILNSLIHLANTYNVYLEGNLLKLIETKHLKGKQKEYFVQADLLFRDKSTRLIQSQEEILKVNNELKVKQAELEQERAKTDALLADTTNRLEAELKRNKDKTLSKVVFYFLLTIIGTILLSASLYLFTYIYGHTSTVMENLVSSMFMLSLGQCFGFIASIYGSKLESNKHE
jgi:hypothetical protein